MSKVVESRLRLHPGGGGAVWAVLTTRQGVVWREVVLQKNTPSPKMAIFMGRSMSHIPGVASGLRRSRGGWRSAADFYRRHRDTYVGLAAGLAAGVERRPWAHRAMLLRLAFALLRAEVCSRAWPAARLTAASPLPAALFGPPGAYSQPRSPR